MCIGTIRLTILLSECFSLSDPERWEPRCGEEAIRFTQSAMHMLRLAESCIRGKFAVKL